VIPQDSFAVSDRGRAARRRNYSRTRGKGRVEPKRPPRTGKQMKQDFFFVAPSTKTRRSKAWFFYLNGWFLRSKTCKEFVEMLTHLPPNLWHLKCKGLQWEQSKIL
jgi:hypothetical protein